MGFIGADFFKANNDSILIIIFVKYFPTAAGCDETNHAVTFVKRRGRILEICDSHPANRLTPPTELNDDLKLWQPYVLFYKGNASKFRISNVVDKYFDTLHLQGTRTSKVQRSRHAQPFHKTCSPVQQLLLGRCDFLYLNQVRFTFWSSQLCSSCSFVSIPANAEIATH